MNRSFAYIYDDFLADNRYERPLAAVEAELSRLGINGRTVRMGMFRDPRDMVSDLVRSGVNTVVVLGHDGTLQQLMWFLAPLGVTVGYIPLSAPHPVGDLLRIPMGAAAVEILAARFVESLDVGLLDGQAFLTEVVVPNGEASCRIGTFVLSPVTKGAIAIRNLGSVADGVAEDARDGKLIAVVQSQTKEASRWPWAKTVCHETRVPFEKGELIATKQAEVFVDGRRVPAKTFTLEVAPGMLKMITGRLRKK